MFHPDPRRFLQTPAPKPFIEVNVAALASKSDYREMTSMLKEGTAVDISHTTVGTMLKRVEQAQATPDEKMIQELAESDVLPEARKMDFLYAGANESDLRHTRITNSDGLAGCTVKNCKEAFSQTDQPLLH